MSRFRIRTRRGRNLRGAPDQTNAERTNIGFATPESRTVSMVQSTPAPALEGSRGVRLSAGEVGTAESVQQFQDELVQDIIEEREEILEESGGRSEETDVIGEDPNQPALEMKSTLSVLYEFTSEYTSDGFLQSFSPMFKRISRGEGGLRQRVFRIARTREAARHSVLIARMKFEVGRQIIDDYKTIQLPSKRKRQTGYDHLSI